MLQHHLVPCSRPAFQSPLWGDVQIVIGGSSWGKRNKWAIDLRREALPPLFHFSIRPPWAPVRWTGLHQACREEDCEIPAHLSSTLRWNADVWPQGAPQATASSQGSVRAPRCVLAVVPHIHLVSWFKSGISDSRSLFSMLKHWSVAVFTCYGGAPLPPPSGEVHGVRKKTPSVPLAGEHLHKMEIYDQIFYIQHKYVTNIPSPYEIWKKII